SIRLSEIEETLYRKGGDTTILSGCLKKLIRDKSYDYILLDVPPTLGLWVRNILSATDHVVIPVEASPWGLFGLANMVSYIGDVRGKKKTPDILGIVLTKVNVRKNYFRDTREFLNDMKDIRIFDTVIRVDSNIEWAQDSSKPVCAYRKGARSAMEYEDLTDEILKRIENTERKA
ncbi:MAG: ParA family protein, partial [Lachnospiraceae bacterium]|nr:ParA family protein [Lachnospiraceae bacterium]